MSICFKIILLKKFSPLPHYTIDRRRICPAAPSPDVLLFCFRVYACITPIQLKLVIYARRGEIVERQWLDDAQPRPGMGRRSIAMCCPRCRSPAMLVSPGTANRMGSQQEGRLRGLWLEFSRVARIRAGCTQWHGAIARQRRSKVVEQVKVQVG